MNTKTHSSRYNPISLEVLYEQLEDEGSAISEYIKSSTLNFILSSLKVHERHTFMLLLTNEGPIEPAFIYAKDKINNFDSKLQKHITRALEKLLETAH